MLRQAGPLDIHPLADYCGVFLCSTELAMHQSVTSNTFNAFIDALRYTESTADSDSRQFVNSVLGSLIHPDLVCSLSMLEYVDSTARRLAVETISAQANAPLSGEQLTHVIALIMPRLLTTR